MAKVVASVSKFFHSDPGHGWLAVKARELTELGIANDISEYSFVKGKSVYLEEDSDMAKYIAAQEARGVTVNVRRGRFWKDRCPVRYFKRYTV